jgi:hypothetical protein
MIAAPREEITLNCSPGPVTQAFLPSREEHIGAKGEEKRLQSLGNGCLFRL